MNAVAVPMINIPQPSTLPIIFSITIPSPLLSINGISVYFHHDAVHCLPHASKIALVAGLPVNAIDGRIARSQCLNDEFRFNKMV